MCSRLKRVWEWSYGPIFFFTWGQYGGDWSALHPGQFNIGKRVARRQSIGMCVWATLMVRALWKGEMFVGAFENCEERLLASSYSTVFSPAWSRLPLDGFSRNFVLDFGEISPTRCNNCVFYSQWLYSTCFGWQSHPSSGVQCCIWPQVSRLT